MTHQRHWLRTAAMLLMLISVFINLLVWAVGSLRPGRRRWGCNGCCDFQMLWSAQFQI